MKIKVADYVANFLVKNNINTVFTVTGGGAMHLNDAFGHHVDLRCIYNHHEQACSMAAEGYTRLSGEVAAVCVTSGPGGTNTLTGVVGAWLDSIPMFVVSGQMKYITTIASTNLPLRQLGFQEYNIIDVAQYMTKYSVLITDVHKIAYHLEKALYLAQAGRPGPVWIDIPLDVQGMMVEPDSLLHFNPSDESIDHRPLLDEKAVEFLLNKISTAKRPVILAGNGIRHGRAEKLFAEVIEKLNIPVVTAWNAHDLIEDDHPLYAGRPGTIGTRGGNFVVQNSDLLISFGCRMNIRQISYEWQKFAHAAFKIAVDIDCNELIKPTLNIDYPIHANVLDVFNKILTTSYQHDNKHSDWIKWCKNINAKYPVVLKKYYDKQPVNPYVFMGELSDKLNANDVIVASNGTACVCSFQAIKISKGERMFTNAGASSMGYGLPAAIGASISLSNKQRIICLEGDGSIQMNLQELQTVVHHKLNIKIFWLNNDGYHSIRQTQSNLFKADECGYCGVSSESGISFPQAKKIAEAYGINYVLMDSHENIEFLLSKVLESDAPVICEVIIDKSQDFSPKLSSKVHADGSISSPALDDMYPFLSKTEMTENTLVGQGE